MTDERKIDKTLWGPGPWQSEPDRLDFRHAGVPCLLLRSELGNWCGYAAVLPGHPWHGKHYSDVEANVHGGLTYAARCQGHICHVPSPGEPDDVWWFGFDCGHWGDRMPGMRHGQLSRAGRYRNLAYAKEETIRLAEQLAEVK